MSNRETRVQEDVDRLRARLLLMCAAVGPALDGACAALLSGSREKARGVLDGDADINALEMEIDEMALPFLACHQPVAQDLRFSVAALRMVIDLERIGDEAAYIAEHALILRDCRPAPDLGLLRPLADQARSFYARAVEAFRDFDADKSLALCRGIDEGARLEMLALQGIIDYLRRPEAGGAGARPEAGLHMILAGRALNRIYRRAANMAEQTFFIVKGANIKHLDRMPGREARQAASGAGPAATRQD